jgi:predicted DNA-binding protein (UPF0278 family)
MADKGLKLWTNMGVAFVDAFLYQSLVEKLNFLIHSHYDVAYSINLVSRFMHAP